MSQWRLDPGQIEVVDDKVAEVLRTKTPTERIAMALEANETMRFVIEGALRTWHPNWTDEQIRREIARRMMRETD